MKKVLFATVATTIFAMVSPVFANPTPEAEQDYEGWRAAQRASAIHQTKPQNSYVTHRLNQERR